MAGALALSNGPHPEAWLLSLNPNKSTSYFLAWLKSQDRAEGHPPFTSPPQRFFHHAVSLSVLVLTDAQKTTTLKQKRAMEASEFHAFHTNYVPWGSRASASHLRHFLPSTKYSKYPKHLFICTFTQPTNIYWALTMFPTLF